MVTVDCSTVPSSTFDIFGSGLVGDKGLKIKDPDGVYLSFRFTIITPYHLQVTDFAPGSHNGIFSIEYGDRVLIALPLQCPILDLSGIYFIDPSRKLKQDLYNIVNRNIPNPTIRTALIGE
jgi:hypothetical protein